MNMGNSSLFVLQLKEDYLVNFNPVLHVYLTWSTSTLCCMCIGSLSGLPTTTPTNITIVSCLSIFSAT